MTQPQTQEPRKPQQDYSPIQYALYNAVIQGEADKIPGLIAQGGDPNARYNDNRHYLHLAVSLNNARVVEELLRGGADVNATESSDEITAVYFAAGSGAPDCLKVLIEHNADLDRECGMERPTTPIQIAITNGRKECIRLLIENGADLSEIDERGDNLLHSAAIHGEVEAIVMLAQHGVDVNARNDSGNTPAHMAGTFIKTDAAWMLKAMGADLTIANKSGRTAEDGLAEKPYHPLVLEKLSEAQANRIKHIRMARNKRHLSL